VCGDLPQAPRLHHQSASVSEQNGLVKAMESVVSVVGPPLASTNH
jgi:hypothetical protein